MRTTKALFATAAALAAGILASSAQVYSANVVGYINVTLTPGYNLIANQLTNGDNSLNVALTNGVVDGMQIQALNGTTIDAADQYYAGFGWYQADGVTPSVRQITPGVGYLINSPAATNVTITLVGNVPQGAITTPIAGGNGFYGCPFPVVSGFSTNGFPQVDGAQYSTFVGYPTPTYSAANQYYAGFGWYMADGVTPTDPAPAVGQGFLLYNPSTATNWVMNFTVQ